MTVHFMAPPDDGEFEADWAICGTDGALSADVVFHPGAIEIVQDGRHGWSCPSCGESSVSPVVALQ